MGNELSARCKSVMSRANNTLYVITLRAHHWREAPAAMGNDLSPMCKSFMLRTNNTPYVLTLHAVAKELEEIKNADGYWISTRRGYCDTVEKDWAIWFKKLHQGLVGETYLWFNDWHIESSKTVWILVSHPIRCFANLLSAKFFLSVSPSSANLFSANRVLSKLSSANLLPAVLRPLHVQLLPLICLVLGWTLSC